MWLFVLNYFLQSPLEGLLNNLLGKCDFKYSRIYVS